jgi:plasmid maintenance system antidote protein VapI
MKAVHVGSLVKLRLVQLGMTKAEFARRINKTPQNIHDLLTRESMDTKLLMTISDVLNYNFFKAFMPENKVEKELKSKRVFLDED